MSKKKKKGEKKKLLTQLLIAQAIINILQGIIEITNKILKMIS